MLSSCRVSQRSLCLFLICIVLPCVMFVILGSIKAEPLQRAGNMTVIRR